MNSWKTTLGGILTAVGALLINNDNPHWKTAGQILSIVGPALLGLTARDHNVSSEQAGIKTPQQNP